jgi:hypothetical protein
MLFFKKARKLTGVHFIILVENNIKPLELYSKQFLGNLARDSIWEQTNLYIISCDSLYVKYSSIKKNLRAIYFV